MLARIQQLLEWDEHTKMPKAGGDYRSDQVSYLAGAIHQKQTAPEIGEWLDQLEASPLAEDPASDSGANLRHLRRDYEKKVRLPQDLVERLSRACSVGQQVWVEARSARDFQLLLPNLEEIIDLKREEAAAIGLQRRCRQQ